MDALRHGAAQVFHGHWLLRFPRKPHNTALLTNSRCSLHERAVPMVWPAFCPVVFLTCRDWFFTFCAFHIRYLSLRSVSRSTGCGSAFFVRHHLTLMNTKPDPEQFARVVLHQLSALRAETVMMHRSVLEILEHQNDGTAASYKKLVMDRESAIAQERDRIYLAALKLANISEQSSGDAPIQGGR